MPSLIGKDKPVKLAYGTSQDPVEFMLQFIDIFTRQDKTLTSCLFGLLGTDIDALNRSDNFHEYSSQDYLVLPMEIHTSKMLLESLQQLTAINYMKWRTERRTLQEVDEEIDAAITNKIATLPSVLTCHIQRFTTGTKKKLLTAYEVPREIDMYPFLTAKYQQCFPAKQIMYELIGVILHKGGEIFKPSDHYVSWVRNEAGHWRQYNDSLVEPLDDSTVNNTLNPKQNFGDYDPTPYVLFYRVKRG
jgi:ubiquitin C-terminal hydrolase